MRLRWTSGWVFFFGRVFCARGTLLDPPSVAPPLISGLVDRWVRDKDGKDRHQGGEGAKALLLWLPEGRKPAMSCGAVGNWCTSNASVPRLKGSCVRETKRQNMLSSPIPHILVPNAMGGMFSYFTVRLVIKLYRGYLSAPSRKHDNLNISIHKFRCFQE